MWILCQGENKAINADRIDFIQTEGNFLKAYSGSVNSHSIGEFPTKEAAQNILFGIMKTICETPEGELPRTGIVIGDKDAYDDSGAAKSNTDEAEEVIDG